MWPFKKREVRSEQMAEIDTSTSEGQLLSALLTGDTVLSVDQAMEIPAVNACVEIISNTVSMVPFKLYKFDGNTKLEEMKDDSRVALLNVDTHDTLNATQFKKAMVKDYLLGKGGYAYIEKKGNKAVALRYVDTGYVSINKNADPIFKNYVIQVNGKAYQPFEFLKLLRNTKDGSSGKGIVEQGSMPLVVAYRTLKFQNTLMKTGGSKKGFIKSPKHLTSEAIRALKDAWNRLFSDNKENVVVLNDGMEFQESSETSAEMQINESVNTNDKQICKMFNVPPQMLNREVGTSSEEDRLMFIQYCIQPILTAFENELNKNLLLESEKGSYKWVADTSEFTKADVLKRYQSYEVACRNGFMQIDEVRLRENMEPLKLDFVRLGLQDVLYYPKDGTTFVPNMNQVGGVKLAMEDREISKKLKLAELEQMTAQDDTKKDEGETNES